jgi:hypothetical protein
MPAIEKTTDERLDERSANVLDGLFGDNPDEVVIPREVKKLEPPNSEDEDEAETPAVEEKPVEKDTDNSEETDWDADVELEKPADAEKDDQVLENESAARKQAKEKGREAKRLKTELTERELELDCIRKEKEELQERLQQAESVKTRPEDAPEFQEKHESVMSDVRAIARRLPVKSRTLLVPNFGSIMVSYMESLDVPLEKSDEVDQALTAQIVDKLGFSEVPFAELDDDEQTALQPHVDKIMDLLERNLTPTKELQKLHVSLNEKAKSGHLSVGVRQYQAAAAELQPALDAVGELSDELIAVNPHSVESFVAKLARGSAEGKKRVASARADVLELLIGPKALTQEEIDKLKANGTDVKEFIRERERNHLEKKKRLAPLLVQALVTRSQFKTTLEKLSKFELSKQSEESEFDALSDVSKKRPSQQSKTKIKASERDPLASLLGSTDD